ncbi:helix-turn-helix domain-containing protein [Bacillus tropicus]|uniref:helix-turn-helix transcriptional regulator n=1 Tax=Bacillus cereus group TaxID=86661 RepID=UPI001D0EB757|nr:MULTISPECIES: helix-turn-helix domain-containing protein [Bacillus cereus group]MCC2339112.1 helix-turn-helix domain-containing protein [Bacillus tropicus]MCU5421764.1 helix-turn-helix domain-containing protein [Bacillus tropicus]MDA2756513.1 helix-turn-helix domain-containing protein [Bacillus cereus group sp. Bc007]MDA2762274.1 helix-turn-helix domain-containing protein [Bacillus cereus group sp. Bc008]MDA2773311.1 helix-turn-helix domain-containing protein [Bacillus cereus group sp. Bc00
MINKIREVREEKKISQTELAKRSGVSRTTLYNIEKGGDTRISIALSIAHSLGEDVGKIFYNSC